MGEVIKFEKPDFLNYMVDNNHKPYGVVVRSLAIEKCNHSAIITLPTGECGEVLSMDEMNQMCIAWLCLHDPDVIKCDEE